MGERQRVQRKKADNQEHDAVLPIVHEVLACEGQPLDAETRALVEPRFGHDFSRVRVHTGTRAADSAEAVNALAYTVGQDIVFGAGQYAPATSEGQKLIVHELAHVIQQSRGGPRSLALPGSPLERAAGHAASAFLQGNQLIQVAGRGAPGLARQPRLLNESLNPQAFSDAELEREIHFIRQWLLEHQESSPEQQRLETALEHLEGELSQRHRSESQADVLSIAVQARTQRLTDIERAGATAATPEIRAGIARLSGATLAQATAAVAEQLTARAQRPAQGGRSTSLLAATRTIFYAPSLAGSRFYLVDRSGHITGSDDTFFLDFTHLDLVPGNTYFLSRVRVKIAGLEPVEHDALLQVNAGLQLQRGAVAWSSTLGEQVVWMERREAHIEAKAGIAIIVSSTATTDPPTGADLDMTRVGRALRGAAQHLRWAFSAELARLGQNWVDELIETALEQGLELLGRSLPGINAGVLLNDALSFTAWAGEIGSIAGYARTQDELDLASQLIARKLANFIIGEAISGGMSEVSSRGREGASSPRPTAESPGAVPAPSREQRQSGGGHTAERSEGAATDAQSDDPHITQDAVASTRRDQETAIDLTPVAPDRATELRQPTFLQRQRAAALREEALRLEREAVRRRNRASDMVQQAARERGHNPDRADRIEQRAHQLQQNAATLERQVQQLTQEAAEYERGVRSANEALPGPDDVEAMFEQIQSEMPLVQVPLSDIERHPGRLPRLARPLLQSRSGHRVVFRVESERSRQLVRIIGGRNVQIAQGETIYLNFGSLERAVEFALENSRGDTRIIIFEVDEQWVRSLRSAAIPEHQTGELGSHQTRLVDVRFADDQLQIPANLTGELQRFVIPDSGRVIEVIR
jgi:hypothetical protein